MKTVEEFKAFYEAAEKTAIAISDISPHDGCDYVRIGFEGDIEVVFSDRYGDEIWITVTLEQLGSDHGELMRQKQEKEKEAERVAAERLAKKKKDEVITKEANDRRTYERLKSKYGPK